MKSFIQKVRTVAVSVVNTIDDVEAAKLNNRIMYNGIVVKFSSEALLRRYTKINLDRGLVPRGFVKRALDKELLKNTGMIGEAEVSVNQSMEVVLTTTYVKPLEVRL